MTALFSDPSDLSTPEAAQRYDLLFSEQADVQRISEQGGKARSLAAVALAIGAGFFVYRRYMMRQLRQELTMQTTAGDLARVSSRAWMRFSPAWVKMTAPSVARAYALGMHQAGEGTIPPDLLDQAAHEYARTLGEYVHDTSSQAMTEGFNAYVNKKVPRRMAAEKAVTSMGMTPRQTRSLVAAEKLGPEAIHSVMERAPDSKMTRQIETLLLDRARRLGDNESFSASRQAKQLVWMYQLKNGQIPPESEKEWVTARDETVCPSCGPMQAKRVEVDEPFVTDLGNVWTPALHPDCRCDVRLRTPTTSLLTKNAFGIVHKAIPAAALAEFNEEHPRDARGRFAHVDAEDFADLPELDKPSDLGISDLRTSNLGVSNLKMSDLKIGEAKDLRDIKGQDRGNLALPKMNLSLGQKRDLSIQNRISLPEISHEEQARETLRGLPTPAAPAPALSGGKPTQALPLEQQIFVVGNADDDMPNDVVLGPQALGMALAAHWRRSEDRAVNTFLDEDGYFTHGGVDDDGWSYTYALSENQLRRVFRDFANERGGTITVEGEYEDGSSISVKMTTRELGSQLWEQPFWYMPMVHHYDEIVPEVDLFERESADKGTFIPKASYFDEGYQARRKGYWYQYKKQMLRHD